MGCPFLKVAYIGYCSACNFPYNPSINELERQCFKDCFESCINFKDLHASTAAKGSKDLVAQSHA